VTIEKIAKELRLSYVGKHWHELASDGSVTHEQYLFELLRAEYEQRLENGVKRRIKEAKFPYKKYLVDFDRTKYSTEFLPEFEELETLDFIGKNENVVLLGTPSAGKTHYSIALGIKACMTGHSVLYASVAQLIAELKEARNFCLRQKRCKHRPCSPGSLMSNMQITRFRRNFERFSLVILDELGYVSFDKPGAELLFSLISSRNEKGSIIVTSNLTFDRWIEVFHDPALTRATVDRLTHKAHILDISREGGGRFEETLAWLEERKARNNNEF
jgi:DNA replication protein DnaC